MDENIFYPELTLETDDIIMELAIKKDYSKIRDSDKSSKIDILGEIWILIDLSIRFMCIKRVKIF